MRPRHEGRGERRGVHAGSVSAAPSMRPRHEGRGELYSASGTAGASTVLQCGHGTKAVENDRCRRQLGCRDAAFNAATARRPWRTGVKPRLTVATSDLQCGHGTKAVENTKYIRVAL